MSIQQRQHQSKVVLAATVVRRQRISEMTVTVTLAAQIWIIGRCCGKTAVTAVTTRCRSELAFAVASATAMAAARRQQQWCRELG